MCTKSQLEAIEEEMVNYYRSVYGDSIDTIAIKLFQTSSTGTIWKYKGSPR